MRKTIKRLMAACLIICLLPFADYSTALAAGNAGVVNTGAGNNETGNAGAVNSGVENSEAGNIEVGNTGIEEKNGSNNGEEAGSHSGTEENGGNQEAAEPDGNMAPTEDSTDDIYIEPAGAGSTESFALSENNTGDDGLLPEAGKTDRTGESADCNMQIHAQIHKKGYVELCWQEFEEGASGYRIYRNEQLLAETEETEFQDREPERNAVYAYKVAVLDEEGQEIVQDYSTQIEIPDNYQMDYNSSLILNEDMIVYDLKASGELDLNGHSLTVLNAANLNGRISFHGGSLLVNHDVQINCSGFEMTAEEDYLYAGGNVSWNAWSYGYYDGRVINLQKGTMEIKGDFLAGETDTFLASGDFCTIFNGEEKQTIELYKGEAAFGRVELANNSEEGVYAREPFVCSEFIQNDTRLVVGADEVTSGFELEEDMVMEGDFCLGGGILDLAGHTLTIQGSLIQTGGTVFVNSGRLVIEGDYRIQSRMDNEDENTLEEYQYGKSAGILNMTMDGDEVLVKGGFYTDSKMDHQGMLAKGTLEVKGDFYEYAQSSFGNFIATDEHKVILSGEGKQTVSFGINRASASGFSNLELRNASEEGILFVNRPYVAGELNGNDTRTEGEVSVGSRTVYKNGCYGGDIYVIGNFAVREPLTIGGNVTVASYLSLYDRMTVEGNVTVQKNCLTFMGGELIVKQNFSVLGGSANYGIKMTNETDRLSVSGDFYYEAAGSMSKAAGTIEVKGNVEIVKGFIAEGSHVFLLNGDGKQEVSMKEGNAFYELWVENYSEEGVHVLTDIIFDSIKENGCNITYFSGMLSKDETVDGDYELTGENFNFNGKTLTVNGDYIQRQGILKLNKGKLVVEGDFILSEGTVQMTGGSIIVKGSLIQEGGTIQVENGSLTIEGDYRLQKRSGQEADYSYEACSGILQMTKEGGRVLVKGDFHTASTADHTDCFTNGILEIKGNLVQETGGNECNLVFSMEHLLLLSGTEKQTVSFLPVKLEKDKLYYQRMSCIANLEVTNKGKEGIEFINEPVVNGRINDNHNKITGAISIININWNKAIFEDGYYGGDIALWCGRLGYGYKDEIHIAGDVRAYSGLSASNNLEIEGDCVVIEGSMNPDKYCISVGGNLTIKNTSYGLYFSNSGKVVVEGNLDYQPDKYREGYLESGTLEVKGDALISGSFRTSGTQVIFSGEKKQMIYAGAALFKRLVLSNNSEEGVIANMLLNYSDLETNGCRIVYGMENDLEYAVTGFTLQEDYTAKGDLYLMDGNMDLNGHTLTVEGDLIQASGDMNINGGALIVKGSYRMQYRTGLEGSYKYGSGKGGLVMTGEKDRVLVCGDFYCSTLKNMSGLLTNGTMEVRGDFRQNAAENFIATENHTVVLGRKLDENGSAFVQTVFFERSPGITRFHKVVLTKLNETGYVFKNDISSISDEVLYDYCDEEPPSAVTKISVTGAECSSITIAYEGAVDNERILGYEIYRDGVKIGETSAKSFKDSGLKADKEYTYQVFAFDGYRNVAKTSPECAGRTLVDLEAPEAVRGLKIKSVTGSSVTIVWGRSSDNVEVTGYKVYGDGKELATVNGECIYKDMGLSEGKVHTYQVTAIDESGNESEKSEEVKASAKMPEFLHILPNNDNSIGGENVTLSAFYGGEYKTGDCSLDIEYYDQEKKEWTSIVQGLSGDSYISPQCYCLYYKWNISEFPEQKLKVRFMLSDVDGNTTTKEQSYYIDRTPPKKPVGVIAKDQEGTIAVSWNPSSDKDCSYYNVFRIERKTGECKKIKVLFGIDNNSCIDSSVVAGKQYEYYVQAVDNFGQESILSDSAFVFVSEDTQAPELQSIQVPQKVNKIANINVYARDNRKISEIALYYKAEREETYRLLEKKSSARTIQRFEWDTTKEKDGNYILKAVAVDEAGNCSDSLSVRTVRCQVDNTGVSQVKITGSTVTSTEVQLTWSDLKEKDRAGFQVVRIEGEKRIPMTYEKALGANLKYLKPNTEYTFVVIGYDDVGNPGPESEPYKVTTQSDTISPVISYLYARCSGKKHNIQLSYRVIDNDAVDKIMFSYSRDNINYEEICTVSSDGNRVCEDNVYWDITDVEEGNVYVKVSAYDQSGNMTETSENDAVQFPIDKTAPNPVKNLHILDDNSTFTWDKAEEEDFKEYKIYRSYLNADMFRYIGKTSTNSFCDRTAAESQTYYYKVTAVDLYDNESDESDIIIWTSVADRIAPKVTGFSIGNGKTAGRNPEFHVISTDNFALSAISMEYRKKGTDSWLPIGEYQVEGDVAELKETWSTEGLVSGTYEIRIAAIDKRENYSDYYTVDFYLDVDAPKTPAITAEEIEGKVHISFSENTEEDFTGYKLYKKENSSDRYECIMEGTENEYSDEEVALSTKYLYYVEAYDQTGNYSSSEEAVIVTDDVDKQAPKVTLGSFEPIEGREMEFFPETEWDNVEIVKYIWDFGDGETSTARNPRHTFREPGKYTITLSVEDEAGNRKMAQSQVEVAPKGTKGVHKLFVRDENDQPVKNAAVILYLSDDNQPMYYTDDSGTVSITGEKGIFQVAVNAEGFSIQEGTVTIDSERDTESRIILKNGLPIMGNIETKKLSLEELKDLGVDFTATDNFSRYTFYGELTFVRQGVKTETIRISAGSQGSSGSGGNYGGGCGFSNGRGGTGTITQLRDSEEPVFAYFYMEPTTVSWLKDMYQVQFAILNMADEKYPIENAKAVLELPKGLSLAKLKTAQTLSKEIGTVGGNQERATSWVVKVDAAGEHTVNVNFQGILQPFGTKVKQTFSATGRYTSTNGKGLHLYIYPEKTAHNLETYYVQYQLVNEADIDCNYVTVNFGKYETPEKVEKVYSYLNGELHNVIEKRSGIRYYMPSKGVDGQLPILSKGDSLTVETLKPGQSIYGTYARIFQGLGKPEETYYKLCSVMVKEIKSETNANLKVTVQPKEGHLEKSRLFVDINLGSYTNDLISALKNVLNTLSESFTPKKCSGDPVNIMTGGFESSQTIMQAAGINKLDFTISYDSRNTEEKGDMGYGWYHNYESRIEECGNGIRVYWNPNSYATFANKNAMNSIVEGIYQDGTMWLTDTLSENNVPKEEQKQTRNAVSENSVLENSVSKNSISEKDIYSYFSGNFGQDYEQDENIISREGSDIGMEQIEEGKNTYLPTSEGMKGCRVLKTEEGYCMYAAGGECFRYDTEGNLASVENQKGQKITFTRSGSCMVIADEGTDKSITAYYDENGNITTLRDNGGNQAVFTYDGNNNLTAVKSKGGTTTAYQYDENHRILSGKDTDGNLFVENTYDEKGRVLTQDDGDQTTELMEISYEDDEESGRTTISVKNTNGGRETVVANMFGEGLTYTDSLGAVTQWEYDAEGRVTAFREGDGNSGRIAYDENGNIISQTESGGKTTAYTYDENNRLLSQNCNDGTSLTYTYGENNQPVSITSGNGATVRYEYNENGQVTKETVEGLGETAYEYSGGLITQITDSNGNVSKCLYDSIGNVVQCINGKGIVTDYEIATNGKVLKETVTLADGSKAVTSYAYDAYGNQTGKTDANGNTTAYTYDRNDRLVKETRADGSAIIYERDVDGNITKITYPDGMTTIEAAYDTAGNLLTLKDALKSTMVQNFNSGSQLMGTALANGGQITYSYYDNGLLKSETDAMGNTTAYTYDGAGRVTGITDKMGNTTSYGYDSAGNATTVIKPEGETVTIAYNQYRQAVSTTDAKGNIIRYEYDGMGNCVRMTDALGHVTEYEYNGSNEIVKVIRKGENGHDDIILTYAYDHLGNVTSVTDGEGNTYRMDYDKVGNLKAVYDAYGTAVESYSYDKVYNQTSVKDAKGNETEMSYDSLGNMVSMLNKATGSATTYAYVGGQLLSSSTDALGGKVTAEHDAMGNIKRFTNPNGGVTEYTYDLNKRVTGESIGSEYKHTYEYNANGQVIKKTNSRGQVTEYTYDKAGRLTSLTDQLGTIRYAYDKNGNVLTVADSQGTITREYDALNRVTSYTDARGNTIRYDYDEFGNLTELTYPNGEKVIYTHDKNGNRKNATDWEGRTTAYEYDRNSRLVKTIRPDGTVETRTYDKAGQLLTILDKKGSQTVNSQEYAYDISGNITEVKASQKGEMQVSGDIANTSMEYDKTNRLIKYNGKEVKYDKDGNMVYGPLNGEMAGFVYDCRNRLVQAGTTKYEYDAEDNRTAVIKNAGTREEVRIEYVVDSVEELSRVLMAVEKKSGSKTSGNSMESTTDNGITGSITAGTTAGTTGNEAFQTTYFYYGNGLLAQENEKEGYLTYHFNNVGSTNAVTDENGAVRYTYAYNPYGELTKGSYGQVMFLFNGQYGVASDDNGLYYMRARYYNVSIKRFINQDVVTGSIAESQSLNRYAYVEGNPVNYFDPFGLEPLLTDELHEFASGLSAAGAVAGFLNPSVGFFIGEIAFFFDTGVYINDIFTSKFDGDVIKKALSNTVFNGQLFTVGTMAYLGKLGDVSKIIGDISSIITIGTTKMNLEQKIVKKIIEKVKEYLDEKKSKEKGDIND